MNVFCLFSSNYYYSNNGFAKRSIQKKTLKSPCLYDHNLTRNKGNSLKLENANSNKNSEKSKTFSRFFMKKRCAVKLHVSNYQNYILWCRFKWWWKICFWCLFHYFFIFFWSTALVIENNGIILLKSLSTDWG